MQCSDIRRHNTVFIVMSIEYVHGSVGMIEKGVEDSNKMFRSICARSLRHLGAVQTKSVSALPK